MRFKKFLSSARHGHWVGFMEKRREGEGEKLYKNGIEKGEIMVGFY